MEKKKMTVVIAVIVVLLLLAAGIFGYRVWADDQTEALRTETVVEIEDTKLANYEKDDREQVKELMAQYIEAVQKADGESEIEAAFAAFEKALESIETAGDKLEASRAAAMETLEGWKLSKYDKDGKAEIKKLIEKYTGRIEIANSAAEIEKLVKQFRSAVGNVQTKEEKEEQERLEEEKRKQEEEAKKAEEDQQNATPSKAASKSAAQQYVGGSAAALAAAIGQPNSKSYSGSCLGPGQDGVWYYSGFTVYTYKENGNETVMSVE